MKNKDLFFLNKHAGQNNQYFKVYNDGTNIEIYILEECNKEIINDIIFDPIFSQFDNHLLDIIINRLLGIKKEKEYIRINLENSTKGPHLVIKLYGRNLTDKLVITIEDKEIVDMRIAAFGYDKIFVCDKNKNKELTSIENQIIQLDEMIDAFEKADY